MKKIARLLIIVVGSMLCVWPLYSGQQAGQRSAEEILRSYVQDFQNDPAAAEPITFGIKIKDEAHGEWQVTVGGKKDAAGKYPVELGRGLPSKPSAIYTLDLVTLQRIDRGEINALTAMGKARASDPAPMDIDVMEGFQPTPEFLAAFIPLTFHFWTRGFPETVVFDKEHSREVHGANMVVLYYEKGLRSAWGQVEKGQRVNADPKDQVNPFPTMFICLKGRATVKVAGKEVMLRAGQMVFIPPGVSHEAWNPYDEPAEVILLMFGEGA